LIPAPRALQPLPGTANASHGNADRLLALIAALSIAGCASAPHGSAPPAALTPPVEQPSPSGGGAANPPFVPDAIPRVEPRSRYGNPPYYDVFGKRYYVLASSVDYIERGVASWYGPGFHQVLTSTREPYDMYAMTAAHKTLPLPAYVRVTNLQNGRSVVVRVNDRGPFVGNRIIDLSYSAAVRLDMLRDGTAMVEVRSIDPTQPLPAATPSPASPPLPAATPSPATPHAPLYVQAGAFADPDNAQRLAAKLRRGSFGTIFIRHDVIAGRGMYRVRIGPVPDVPDYDRIVAALEQAGVRDAHLALD
jgi:rare lipoprotein A